MVKDFFDGIANWLSNAAGSNASLAVHTLVFLAFCGAYFLGFDLTQMLLVLTTLVSVEAIYLSLIIQRSVNLQTRKMDHVIESIRENTVPHLKKPMDEVIGEIKTELDEIALRKRKNGARRKKRA